VSHIVEIHTEIRDPTAVAAACQRLNLPAPADGTTRLYSGTVSGLAVQLPGWKYPVVCDLPSGRLQYDNFQGRWGADQELHRLLQAYAVEKTRLEARRQGHTLTERPLDDGSIHLTIQVAGGTA
jgi:hypothetical protein